MAVDKLVDSTQLDADLTSVANAIRTKGGTSSQMAFPAGFVSAVQAIPTGITPTGTKQISITQNGTTTEDVTNYASAEITVNVSGGGGYSLEDIAEKTQPSGTVDVTGIKMEAYGLNRFPAITKIQGTLDSGSSLESAFADNTGLTSACIICPSASGNRPFGSCTNLVTAALIASATYEGLNYFNGCTKLEVADLLVKRLRTNCFYNCTKCATLILRNTSICALENTGVLSGQTPFKSGGAGGTIYIPKVLYDHLGDGTALDYKAATNWSTIEGYGTITWAKIEGSYYETHYADGTVIS